nr:MAG TPA_asm: hypothetical protein [Caudoviricetes sp.]
MLKYLYLLVYLPLTESIAITVDVMLGRKHPSCAVIGTATAVNGVLKLIGSVV